jgi:hypothetical protein
MISKKPSLVSLLCLLAALCFCPGTYAEDVILDIGNGSAEAGSENGSITLTLDNSSDIVTGVHVYICDEGNYLSVKSCASTGRASSLSCYVNECRTDAKISECRRAPGCADISLMGFGDTIAPGKGPIARINFQVSENAPSGCIALNPKFASAGRPKIQGVLNQRELTVMPERGQFCISGGSSDDTTTTPRSGDTGDTESPETAAGGEPAAGTAAANSSNAAANAQTGLRTPMGGLTAGGQEASPDTDNFSPTGSSSRNRTTGSKSSAASRETDTRSAGASGTKSASVSEESRLIISPSVSVINSKGILALDAHTIAGGREVPGKYKWEIFPPSGIGSTIDGDGIFTAGINTSGSPVQETIRATDTSNKSMSAIATITIEGAKEPSEGCALLLTPSSAEISPGNVITFTVKKVGKTCAEGDYQWKVSSKIGSTITEAGLYKAGINRTNEEALDIIMVKDGRDNLSSDALVTVAPGDQFSPAGSADGGAVDSRTAKPGSPFSPGTLIALAAFIAVTGILLVRKKK